MVDVAKSPFPPRMYRSNQSEYDLDGLTGQLIDQVKTYAVEKPLHFAVWTFSIGFVLGWRLKPW